MTILRTAILIIFVLLSCKCNDGGSDPVIDDDGIQEEINVKVDPRMELLAVIQHYTLWADIRHTKLDFSYKNELDEYFKDYSEHSAVEMSEDLTNSGFSYDAPATFVLYHSDPPELEQTVPYTDYLILRAGGKSNLEEFADKIREFAVESNFMEFFNSHKNYYAELENIVKKTIGSYSYITLLEDYYGETKKSYNIIPTQLFHAGGYGPEINTSEGKEIFNICGPQRIVNGYPNFGDKDYMLGIILHEFSHSFVNPVTAKNLNEINECSALFDPIRDKMEEQAYGTWTTCVNEHLVRANVARFALKLWGEEKKENVLEAEVNRGFIYIRDIDTLMEEYENSRDTYGTYESFYPRIIELFKSLM